MNNISRECDQTTKRNSHSHIRLVTCYLLRASHLTSSRILGVRVKAREDDYTISDAASEVRTSNDHRHTGKIVLCESVLLRLD